MLRTGSRRTSLRKLLWALVTVVALLLTALPAAAQPPEGPEQAPREARHRESSDTRLANGVLREEVDRREAGQGRGDRVRYAGGDRVVVEVLHDLADPEARRRVRDHGGRVTGEVRDTLVQAEVPWDELEGLEAEDGVRYLRPPLEANALPQEEETTTDDHGSIVGEEVEKSNADEWHAAGFTGSGTKIAIFDYFDGGAYSDAQDAGEVPPPAGTFCRAGGSSCDVFTATPGVAHGVAVAEIVHEMAPDAELYLVVTATLSDLQAAVDYADDQGVDVITRSLGSEYDGPGDGTGPIDTVFEDAVDKGMVVLNSAGNSAWRGGGSRHGSHWKGPWQDADDDEFLEFDGSDEGLGFDCGFTFGVRWDDWGSSNPTDYDVVITDADRNVVAGSHNDQTGGAPPLEDVDLDCGSLPKDLLLFVVLYDPGDGTSDDEIQLQHGPQTEYWTNPYSATQPVVDSASPGVLGVGAVDPPTETTIAPYSSEGPTNDERIKPDIAAAAGVDTFTYETFAGTSAAAPAVAGAASLVIGAGEASDPSGVKDYLQTEGVVDRGDPGSDNLYGAGELLLPTPPDETSSATCGGLELTIVGTADDDDITGTAGDDVIHAGPGDDTVDGRGGDDTICLGGGDDVANGGPGNDTLYGATGADVLRGQDDDDTLVGGPGNDVLVGAAGNDILRGQGDDDELRSHGGDDNLVGGAGNDEFFAGPGSDHLRGQGGDDTLRGHGGNDQLFGGPGGDLLLAGAHDDTLRGHGGPDSFNGGPGIDDCVDFDAVEDVGQVNC